MNLGDILFVLIIFQLLLISLFLFTQSKGKPLSNGLLGFFFFSICLNLLDVFLLQKRVYFGHPGFAGLGSSLPALFGPLLYFYTRSVVYKNFSLTSKSLAHFIPFALLFTGTEFYYLIQPSQVQEKILRALYDHRVPAIISLVSTLVFLQFLFYAIHSLRMVSAYKKAASQLFSDPRVIDVSWLSSTIIFFILIIVVSLLNSVLAQTALAKYYLVAFNLVVLALFAFVVRVMLKAFGQPYFFSFAEKEEFKQQLAVSVKGGLTAAERNDKERIVQTVTEFMKTEKPYLDAELTLDQLASKISLKPRVLSEAINDILQQNFFDFINRYRIDEAKALLTNPKDKKITVLEVLYEVGFNSKSSFNTLFRKYTGLTPTEFRKQQEN